MAEFEHKYIKEPLFEEAGLWAVLDLPQWSMLAPNYPSPKALSPQSLTDTDLWLITDAFKENSPLTRIENVPYPDKPEVLLDNGMKISYFDRGESKWCYLLSDGNLRMAVILGGYDPQFPIPADPRLTYVNYGIGKNFLSYCDLRTYLCLPIMLTHFDGYDWVEASSSLVFQEWGGTKKLSDPSDLRIKRASQSVRSYIQARGLNITSDTDRELTHPRHYLLNRGLLHLPVVIDIPCVEIKP